MTPQSSENLKSLARSLDRIVAIVFYGRSGSVFMQSLLDNHPNVFTTPGTHIVDFYGFIARLGKKTNREAIVEFSNFFSVLFDARSECPAWEILPVANGIVLGFDHMGPDRDQVLKIDRDLFTRTINDIQDADEPVNSKGFLQAVHVAYASALGRVMHEDSRNLIVFPMHVPEKFHADLIAHDFPDAKFMYMVREPIQAQTSYFAHFYKGGEASYSSAARLWDQAFRGTSPLTPTCGFKAVRLEDLHKSAEATMRTVAAWLDISWHPNLLDSTFDGLKWWNLRDAPQISGFSEKIISKKHEEYLTTFDCFRLKVLLAPEFQTWEYQLEPKFGSFLLKLITLFLVLIPFKTEVMAMKQAAESDRHQPLTIAYRCFKAYVLGRIVCWNKLLTNMITKPYTVPLLK